MQERNVRWAATGKSASATKAERANRKINASMYSSGEVETAGFPKGDPAVGPERLYAMASGMGTAVIAANRMGPSWTGVGRNDRGAQHRECSNHKQQVSHNFLQKETQRPRSIRSDGPSK